MATVKIPPVLRSSVGGEKEVQADGGNVGEVLRALADAHPATESQLFSGEGELEPLRQRVPQRRGRPRARTAWTPGVGDGDTIVILPAMAGGAA